MQRKVEGFLKVLPCVTQEEADYVESILDWDDETKMAFKFAKRIFEEDVQEEGNMDKKIKKLQKDTKKLAKQETELLKADKKRDKVCDYGEKAMKQKKK